MGKKIRTLLLCVLAAGLLMTTALAERHDAEEEVGTLPTIGEMAPFYYDENGDYVGGTEFYIRIENPKPYEEGPVTTPSSIPKTGDSGVQLEMLLLTALGFGGAYLLCAEYEKKTTA